jgi:hypothetical protein
MTGRRALRPIPEGIDSERLVGGSGALLFSSPALGNKPRDNADYRQNQNHSHPDSGLEDVSDDLTTSQGQSRKEQQDE